MQWFLNLPFSTIFVYTLFQENLDIKIANMHINRKNLTDNPLLMNIGNVVK